MQKFLTITIEEFNRLETELKKVKLDNSILKSHNRSLKNKIEIVTFNKLDEDIRRLKFENKKLRIEIREIKGRLLNE